MQEQRKSGKISPFVPRLARHPQIRLGADHEILLPLRHKQIRALSLREIGQPLQASYTRKGKTTRHK